MGHSSDDTVMAVITLVICHGIDDTVMLWLRIVLAGTAGQNQHCALNSRGDPGLDPTSWTLLENSECNATIGVHLQEIYTTQAKDAWILQRREA